MNKQAVSVKSIVSQEAGNIVSDMDGEKVMLSINNGKYYNLGAIGGEIWELMSEPTTVGEIVATLLTQYEVEASVCEEEVISFVETMTKEGLVNLKEV